MKKNQEATGVIQEVTPEVKKPTASYVLSYALGEKTGTVGYGKSRKVAIQTAKAMQANGFTVTLSLTKVVEF